MLKHSFPTRRSACVCGRGEGPRLSPPVTVVGIESLVPRLERLDPIIETVRRVADALPPQVTFLGFAGSPWTIATYMVTGHGSRDHADARRLAYRDPAGFQQLIDRIVEATDRKITRLNSSH